MTWFNTLCNVYLLMQIIYLFCQYHINTEVKLFFAKYFKYSISGWILFKLGVFISSLETHMEIQNMQKVTTLDLLQLWYMAGWTISLVPVSPEIHQSQRGSRRVVCTWLRRRSFRPPLSITLSKFRTKQIYSMLNAGLKVV